VGDSLPAVSDDGIDETLAGYRSTIDNIDATLILLLAERFKVTKQVGVHKANVGLPVADPEREEQQIARLTALAESTNLDPSFSEQFLRLIIDEVIRHHEQARDEASTAGD
jgi:chorismate mutase